MNRRDVLKGIATLPIAGGPAVYAKLCGGPPSCPAAANLIQIVLDGPFSVVLQTASPTSDDITGVLAFTPVEPNGAHLIKLNGVPLDERKQHHFTLKISGYTPPLHPCISSAFNDFCNDHTKFNPLASDMFVALKLPCPKNITTDIVNVPPLSVTVGGSPRSMPQNHVLEYDVPMGSSVIMDYRESGHPATPVGNTFLFEVGMDHPDTDCSHAKDFFNHSTLPFFPDLSQNTIEFPNCPRATPPHRYFMQAKYKDDSIKAHMYTTTLECKSGGLIGTSP